MENRTLISIPLMMGLVLLTMGCGLLGPESLVLQPTELCIDHGNSDIATFEDPNMERAVRDWSGERNDLTCGLVSGFGGIPMHDYGITSLVGIQNLQRLSSLELGNNLITDITALSGLTHLRDLTLYNNSITDISAAERAHEPDVPPALQQFDHQHQRTERAHEPDVARP